MVIGLLSLEIYLPFSHSLKDKRRVLKALRDRVQHKFNAAVAEVDFQDKWQRAKVGIVTLNSQKGMVDQVLQKILRVAEQNLEGEIVQCEVRYF
ncbi:MAG: DUF503 domain-containing protein [Acidobacteriota bacterium]